MFRHEFGFRATYRRIASFFCEPVERGPFAVPASPGTLCRTNGIARDLTVHRICFEYVSSHQVDLHSETTDSENKVTRHFYKVLSHLDTHVGSRALAFTSRGRSKNPGTTTLNPEIWIAIMLTSLQEPEGTIRRPTPKEAS